MKKLFFLLITVVSAYSANAQGWGGAVSAGYLTEIDSFGGSADLIYEFNEKWGVSSTFTYAVGSANDVRTKWTILDLNARYKVYDEVYLLAGGEYISAKLEQQGLSAGNPLSQELTFTDSDFGANIGAGYKYNLMDNVNLFGEVKYVALETGYIHGRLGLLFDF